MSNYVKTNINTYRKEDNEKNISLISREVNGFCLSYVNRDYTLFFDDKDCKFPNMNDPQELYDDLTVHDYSEMNNQNKLIIGDIASKSNITTAEAETILSKLMKDLYDIHFNTPKEKQASTVNQILQGIKNPKIKEKFQQQITAYEKSKYTEILAEIKAKLDLRKRGEIELARRDLSDYLTAKYGLILRKHVGTLYIRDDKGYTQTTHDDLILKLKNDFNSNFIHDSDIKSAIGFISDRLEPVPNIVKFKNTLFDMNKLEPIEYTEEPIFTLLEIPYNYNPNAESTIMKNFLNTSLARDTEEETKEAVKGIKEFTGYMFTSGNKHEKLPIFTGLTGAGKSVFFNIITAIFGKDRISGVSLQRLEKDQHSGSQFINAHLNIIRDSDTSMITNNTLLKNWTGNEPFNVNPKYKQAFELPSEEVPKPILVCNTMPEFKVYDDAVIRRLVIIEFKVSFTKNNSANPDLEKEILANDEEIEWLIYESIQAYKDKETNEKPFVFEISQEETKELIEKHTHPLNHIIQELILKHDPQAYDNEKMENPDKFMPVYTNDLIEAILYVSNTEGIDVPVDKHGRINKSTLLHVIRDEFDLIDGEVVQDKDTRKYTNHREYKARMRRWKGRNEREYPNLIPTNKYQEAHRSIDADKTLKKQSQRK